MSSGVQTRVVQGFAPQTMQKPTTTAPVHEFMCLFTHDVKRKNQKRWQDGRLKFHTYNKRIVVHDERGNYIGDSHWSGDQGEMGDGEEFMLERGSAMVQVCEQVGTTQQDLGDLVDKRSREVEKRRMKVTAASATSTPNWTRPTDNVQFQRPLSAIMTNTPSRIGRATVSHHSPYEVRQQQREQRDEENNNQEPPPAKRRKRSVSPPSKSGHARSLFGAHLTLCATPLSMSFARNQALRDRTNLGQKQAGVVMKAKPPESVGQEESEQPALELAEDAGNPINESVREQVPRPAVSRKPVRPAVKSRPPKPAAEDTAQSSSLAGRGSSNARVSRKPSSLPSKHQKPVTISDDESKYDSGKPEKPAQDPSPQPRKALSKEKPRKPPMRGSTVRGEVRGESNTTSEVNIYHKPTAKTRRTIDIEGSDDDTKDLSPSEKEPVPRNQTLDPSEEPDPKPQEPRTALRIKSRRKRGLMMLAQDPVPTKRPKKEASDDVSMDAKDSCPSHKEQTFEEWIGESLVEEGDIISHDQPIEADQPISKKMSTENNEPTHLHSDNESEISLDKGLALPQEKHSIHTPDLDTTHGENEDKGKPPQAQKEDHVYPVASPSEDSDVPPPVSKKRAESTRTKSRLQHLLAENKLLSEYEDDGSQESDDWQGPPPDINKKKTQAKRASRKKGKDSRAKVPPENKALSEDEDDSSQESNNWQGPPPEANKKKIQSKRAPRNRDKDSEAKLGGLRISRMARKSVKSKEIFGFKSPGDGQFIPTALASAFGRVGMVQAATSVAPADVRSKVPDQPAERDQVIDNERATVREEVETVSVQPVADTKGLVKPVAEPEQPSDESGAGDIEQTKPPAEKMQKLFDNSKTDDGPKSVPTGAAQESNKQPGGRLVNPATRGRKAASKADAAGLVPQPLVPFDSVTVSGAISGPVSVSAAAKKPHTVPAVTSAALRKASEPKQPVTDLPGFTKANGGAWSKHAEDLLGMTRPRTNTLRR